MKRIMMMMTLVMMASTAWAQVSLDVVWTDLSFGGGSTNEGQSVAFNRNRVIAGEVLGNASGGTSVHVKGYNANTGNLVWEDVMDGFAVRVDAAGNDAFAVIMGSDLVIRRYNRRTGDLEWSTPIPTIAIRAFGVRGNRVLLTGYSGGPFGINGVLFVLDRETGNLLRTTLLEGPQMLPITNSIFWDFDRTGTDLVVVGTQERIGVPTLVLQDYRVSDGQLKWETIEPNSAARSVQLANGLVYVSNGGMAAYSLMNGASVWKTANVATDFPIFTVSGAALFLSSRVDVVQGNYALERRNPFTGALIWHTPIPAIPMRDQTIGGIGLVHGYIVLVGSTQPSVIFPGGNEQLIVRVFDEHGNLLLTDKSDQAPQARFDDHAIEGNRIVGVGTLSGPLGGAFVRMYQLLVGQLSLGPTTGIQP